MLVERNKTYHQLKENKEALKNYLYRTEAQYKQEFAFLAEVDSKALQSSTRNLLTAFNFYFKDLKGRNHRIGYPRFKSKKSKQSYTTYNINNNIKINFGEKRIKLPKIKNWIKYKDNRFFQERIRHVTVSKTKSCKYYVSILVEKELKIHPITTIKEKYLEAFDMSAYHFLVAKQIKKENPRFYRNREKKLKKLHRRLSRKQKGSKNRNEAQLKLAGFYDKISNSKLHWTHAITNELVDKYDGIILEDLNIKGMQQFNTGLSKSITLDFSWGLFKSILAYKMKWKGKQLLFVDRFFPSSKLCSNCNWKNDALTLDEHTWKCERCGKTHNRDLNAAKNLKREGKLLLKKQNIRLITTVGTTESYACGDHVSLSFESIGR
jgi:putative transposase